MDITRGLPKKITPDPIIDCNFEIRFTTTSSTEEIFGLLYGALKEGYPSLQMTNIPPVIRDQDPNLAFYAEAFLANEHFQIGISKRALSIGCKTPYVGWAQYSKEIEAKLQALLSIPSLVILIQRIGLRYINFFEGIVPMSEVIDLGISFFNEKQYNRKNVGVRTELAKGDISFMLNASDNASTNIKPTVVGNLLDIDVSCSAGLESSLPRLIELVDRLHNEEKALFFSLLRQEFVDKITLEY
jgi:uncharacterized protein (TIGR04255 family)